MKDVYLPLARRLLEQSDPSRQLSAGTLEHLLAASRLQRHAAGRQVSQRGQSMPDLLFVVEGSLEVSMEDGEGRRSICWYNGAGQWLGLISMIDRKNAIHDARAHSEVVLLHVPRQTFLRVLEQDPGLARYCLQVLCERSRSLYENLAAGGLLPMRARIARMLLMLLDQHGREGHSGLEIDLKLSQDDFADMLGVTRQSLNRELKALEKQGLITIAYSRITLHDVPQLRSMAAVAESGPAAAG